MTPKQAIEKAKKNEFCRVGRDAYLWLTEAAQKQLQVNAKTAFFLITEDRGPENPIPVASEKNKTLIRMCNGK